MDNPTIRRRLALIRQRVQSSEPLEPPDARLLLELVDCGLLVLGSDLGQRAEQPEASRRS